MHEGLRLVDGFSREDQEWHDAHIRTRHVSQHNMDRYGA